MNNYESELSRMEQSVQNLPCWVLTAISRIIEAEMNEREAVTAGLKNPLTDNLTAKGDESIDDGSGTAKPHLTIVKSGEVK